MIEALGSDYVRTARAKGLTEGRVVVVHALRNSLLTVVTVIGLELGALISGRWSPSRSFSYRASAA